MIAAAVLAEALLLMGCVHDVSGTVDRTLWEASLAGTGAQPTATGSAAAISGTRSTETGIVVQGMIPGRYTWKIRDGGCARPGEVVGSAAQYPALLVPLEGEASLDGVVVSGRMDAGRTFHADVRDANGEVVACGNFVEWQ
jgi:hypothetical protein